MAVGYVCHPQNLFNQFRQPGVSEKFFLQLYGTVQAQISSPNYPDDRTIQGILLHAGVSKCIFKSQEQYSAYQDKAWEKNLKDYIAISKSQMFIPSEALESWVKTQQRAWKTGSLTERRRTQLQVSSNTVLSCCFVLYSVSSNLLYILMDCRLET